MERKLIENIVTASGITNGELVLVQFWGEDKDIEIMHIAADTVASLGASPVEMQQSRTVNTQRFTGIKESAFNEKYFAHMSNFDAVIDIFSYPPVVLENTPDNFQMDIYRKYMGNLFGALSKVKRFTQIRVPTEENAKESNLSYEEYRSRMLMAMDIDYKALQQNCEDSVNKLCEKTELTLITGDNYKLQFELGDRKWLIDAGDGDIPAGEVYIAPLENKTNGTVFFETLFAGHFGKFTNILLTVENGIVITTNNDVLNENFAKLDDASKTVCELGFGQNPHINSLCGYAVLDEKAQNTFHIAIGNNTMFGGKNNAPLHMDFVGTGKIL